MRIEKRVEKEVGRLMLPDIQIYYKAATIKTHGERDAEINKRASRNRLCTLANCFSTKGRSTGKERPLQQTLLAQPDIYVTINHLPYTLHHKKKIKPKLIMELM